MAKAIDYISVTIVSFLLTFVCTALVFDNNVAALVMSCALTLIAVVTLRFVISKYTKPYSYDRLALEFAIRGNEYVIKLLISILKNREIESGSNYILLDDSIVISSFKLTALGVSDVGAACERAKEKRRKRAFVICSSVDRRAYAVAQLEGVKLCPVKPKAVYKLLKKHSALPNLKPAKQKFALRALFEIILSRSNFKSYAFSGVVLIAISFLTPLKIYYMVIGSVNLLLALLTLTPLGNGSVFGSGFGDEMEKASNQSSNQISIDELLDK